MKSPRNHESPREVERHAHRAKAGARAALALLLLGAVLVAPGAWAGPTPEEGERGSSLARVYAHTLEHRKAAEAVAHIRPLLSPHGTVEEQLANNTIVIRDAQAVVAKVAEALRAFDHPPRDLRLDIRMVKAGPERRTVISPPRNAGSPELKAELPEALAKRLRSLLRYDDFQVLAHAGVSSQEGEEVVYSLGDEYDISFRVGSVLGGQRLKLEGFRLTRKTRGTSKGRQLPPKELFHATLNLWLDKPFTLVLTQEENREEALMVAIACSRETPSSEADDLGEAGSDENRRGEALRPE